MSGVVSFEVKGTAMDCLNQADPSEHHLVVAGNSSVTAILVSGPNPVVQQFKFRTNRQRVKRLKFNALRSEYFAASSDRFIDVYVAGGTYMLQRLSSFIAQSRNISDFSWCTFDENLLASCAENDSVSIWDTRNPKKPSVEISHFIGANQAKFAPRLNNYLLTSYGSIVQLWDLRHTNRPISHFNSAESRITCVEWHPHPREPNTFITASIDGTIKTWSLIHRKGDSSKSVSMLSSIWRLNFASDGDHLAAISFPSHESLNNVNIFTNPSLDKPHPVKLASTAKDIIVDASWQRSINKTTAKYLYILSKNQCIYRYPILHESMNEVREEMAMPITQTIFDEERDRQVAQEASDLYFNEPIPARAHRTSTSTSALIGSGSDEVDSAISPPHLQQAESATQLNFLSRFPTENNVSAFTVHDDIKTPNSPNSLHSEWHRWIKAPNVEGDLITQLEALRKHETEGLYTYEINFQRAAIGFTYSHLNCFRKITFEMRLHRSFIENGLVFVEVLQKDSPFTASSAIIFLSLLQHECDEQLRINSDQTILYRVLQQLPRLIESMKVFTPSMEIPRQGLTKTENSSLSGSASDDLITQYPHTIIESQNEDTIAVSNKPIACLISNSATEILHFQSTSTGASTVASYIPSGYDNIVPAPRTCGARFNGTGYLITFGSINYSTALKRTTRSTKASATVQEEENEVSDKENMKKAKLVAKYPHKTKINESLKYRKTELSESNSTQLTGKNITLEVNKAKSIRSLADYSTFLGTEQHHPIILSSGIRHRSSMTNHPQHLQSKQSVASLTGTLGQINHHSSSSAASETTLAENPKNIESNLFPGTQPLSIEPYRETEDLDLHQKTSPLRPFVKAGSPNRAVVGSGGSGGGYSSLQNVSMRHRGNSMSSTGASAVISAAGAVDHLSIPSALESTGFNSVVSIYDSSGLLPVSKQLAASYKLLGESAVKLCRHNLDEVIKKTNRKDLVALWKLLEQCITTRDQSSPHSDVFSSEKFFQTFRTPQNKKILKIALRSMGTNELSTEPPWPVHPFGREMVNSFLEHYLKFFDVQTAAAITCVLGQHIGRRHLSEPRDHLVMRLRCASFRRYNDLTPRSNVLNLPPSTSIGHQSPDLETPGSVRGQQNRFSNSSVCGIGGSLHREGSNLSDTQPITLAKAPDIDMTSEPLTIAVDTTATPSRKSSSVTPTFGHVHSAQNPLAAMPTWSLRIEEAAAPSFITATNLLFTPDSVQQLSDSANFYKTDEIIEEHGAEVEASRDFFLDPALSTRFEEIRYRYADLLYSWRMYRKYAEVLKFCAATSEVGSVTSISWCSRCETLHKQSFRCPSCKIPPIRCAICDEPCRGVVATCSICSHGGHAEHIAYWFSKQQLCPAGCSCQCRS